MNFSLCRKGSGGDFIDKLEEEPFCEFGIISDSRKEKAED